MFSWSAFKLDKLQRFKLSRDLKMGHDHQTRVQICAGRWRSSWCWASKISHHQHGKQSISIIPRTIILSYRGADRQAWTGKQASKQSDRYREDGQDDTDTTRQLEIIRGRQTYLHYEEWETDIQTVRKRGRNRKTQTGKQCGVTDTTRRNERQSDIQTVRKGGRNRKTQTGKQCGVTDTTRKNERQSDIQTVRKGGRNRKTQTGK